MSKNNFFINAYKKNSTSNNASNNEKNPEKFVFEKIEVKDKKEKPQISKKRLAAVFLIALGLDKAKDIVKTFERSELEKIVAEIITIDKITPEEIEEVEKKFGTINKKNSNLTGGKEFARVLLQTSFGITTGSDFFLKSIEKEEPSNFDFINDLNKDELKKILSDESDTVLILVLTNVEPKKAAEILTCLPPELTKSVIKRMSERTEINKSVCDIVIKKLKEKADNFKVDPDLIQIHGKDKLIEILKYTQLNGSSNILQSLEEENPELAQEIKDNIFTFNDIALLTKKDFEKALKHYQDKEIAFILKGAKDAIKTLFFTCVTKRRKQIIEDEMNVLGAVKQKDVDEKRKTFVDFLKDLDAKSEITLHPDKDIFVK